MVEFPQLYYYYYYYYLFVCLFVSVTGHLAVHSAHLKTRIVLIFLFILTLYLPGGRIVLSPTLHKR